MIAVTGLAAPSVRPVALAEASTERPYAWAAVIIGSRLPEVLWCQFAPHPGAWLPIVQAALLICFTAASFVLGRTRTLAWFVLTVTVLYSTWVVAAPWIERSSAFQSLAGELGWAGGFFFSRAIRTIGAVLMILTLIGSGIGKRELLLGFGNWNARVRPWPLPCWHRLIRWRSFAVIFLAACAVVLPCYLLLTLHPKAGGIAMLLPLVPWAVATSALNAANEEFQYRTVLLARLRTIVSRREAVLMTAALFGIAHYFGQPVGWGGIFLATFAGWVWAKSMVETRGFGFAFGAHFIQDMVIFGFLALAIKT